MKTVTVSIVLQVPDDTTHFAIDTNGKGYAYSQEPTPIMESGRVYFNNAVGGKAQHLLTVMKPYGRRDYVAGATYPFAKQSAQAVEPSDIDTAEPSFLDTCTADKFFRVMPRGNRHPYTIVADTVAISLGDGEHSVATFHMMWDGVSNGNPVAVIPLSGVESIISNDNILQGK